MLVSQIYCFGTAVTTKSPEILAGAVMFDLYIIYRSDRRLYLLILLPSHVNEFVFIIIIWWSGRTSSFPSSFPLTKNNSSLHNNTAVWDDNIFILLSMYRERKSVCICLVIAEIFDKSRNSVGVAVIIILGERGTIR